jgi:hypothetical protein
MTGINRQVIDEFRARHGRVGGYFEGARLILLTTTGARTGTPHTTPRDAVFARAVETDPGWAAYQAKTERVIPVVALYEIAQGGPP